MSFRTGFTSNSKAFAELSFNIHLTYLEASWNKLDALGKSVLETVSKACAKSWLVRVLDHHILPTFLKSLLNEIDGKLFIYHHQKTMNIEIHWRKLNCPNVQSVEPMFQSLRSRGKWPVVLTSKEREWS